MNEFSDRLRQKMDERGLTQSSLARRLKVTPTAVWNWQNGNSTPRPRSRNKLAQLLGVELDWLIDGSDEREDESEETRDSLEDEIERFRKWVADLNGIDAERVQVQIIIG